MNQQSSKFYAKDGSRHLSCLGRPLKRAACLFMSSSWVSVKALMQIARQHHIEGRYTEASIECFDAFDDIGRNIFDRRLTSILTSLSCEQAGARVIGGNGFLRMDVTQKTFDESESAANVQFLESIIEKINDLTFNEMLCMYVRRFSNRLLMSSLKLRCKRLLLLPLALLNWVATGFVQEGKEFQEKTAMMLSFVLQEPYSEAKKVLFRQRHQSMVTNIHRHLFEHAKSEYQAYLRDGFYWQDKQAYENYINVSKESRVLLTIHMGDFVSAFQLISQLADPGREAFVLRREQQDIWDERLAGEKARLNYRIMRHGQYNPIQIVSSLRKGNASFSALFDLSDSFGETEEVQFFGQTARFVKGPVEIAIAGRTPIIPFVTYRRGNKNIIEMESAISTDPLKGETMKNATIRILQKLVSNAEEWIRAHPEQWQYLPNIPSYFTVPDVKSTSKRPQLDITKAA